MKKSITKCDPVSKLFKEEDFHGLNEPDVQFEKILALGYSSIRIDLKKEGRARDIKYTKKQSKKTQEVEGKDSEDSMTVSDAGQEGDMVYVCGLIIDINSISKSQILKLRKLMPKKKYR